MGGWTDPVTTTSEEISLVILLVNLHKDAEKRTRLNRFHPIASSYVTKLRRYLETLVQNVFEYGILMDLISYRHSKHSSGLIIQMSSALIFNIRK